MARPTGFSCGRFLQQSASAPSLSPDRSFSAAASMVLSPSGGARHRQPVLGRSLKERCSLLEHSARANSVALSERQEVIDAAWERKREEHRRAAEARDAYLAMLSPEAKLAANREWNPGTAGPDPSSCREAYRAKITANKFTARWQKTLSEAQGAPSDMFLVYSSKRCPGLFDRSRSNQTLSLGRLTSLTGATDLQP
eukprot:TRINITY_DN479_c0_g2_i2.p1 TRINITY_DN479_c0_g2~~TRINITY_DN479_c0_g2_i2.p1  ORF type:complete len:214 (+),score=20.70 TRINITY_DN479_c0_g2_i2:54-644(+)